MSGYSPVTLNGLGSTVPVIIHIPAVANWQAPPCYALGLICTLSNGATLTYSVQVTADPVPADTGHWNNHDVLVAQTASANDSIAYPVTAVRLTVTSYTSGSVTLGIAQWP